jgi:hypothetical protein
MGSGYGWKRAGIELEKGPYKSEMSTSRSSSNGFYAIVCLAIIAACVYKWNQDSGGSRNGSEYAIAVTQVIEPAYVELFSEININQAWDMVPRMTDIRKLIVDKQAKASVEKRQVYASALKLVDGMIDVGEVRTAALESLLKTTKQPRALETKRTSTSAAQLFIDAQKRRSMEALMVRKPGLDKLFAQVQDEERKWNANLPKSRLPEFYDPSKLSRTRLGVDVTFASQNPLEQKSYDRRGMSDRKRMEMFRYQGGYAP